MQVACEVVRCDAGGMCVRGQNSWGTTEHLKQCACGGNRLNPNNGTTHHRTSPQNFTTEFHTGLPTHSPQKRTTLSPWSSRSLSVRRMLVTLQPAFGGYPLPIGRSAAHCTSITASVPIVS